MTTKVTPKPDPVGDTTEFPIILNGKPVTLVVTAAALVATSRAFGGLVPAAEAVRAMNVVSLGTLVHVGLNRPSTGAAVEKTIMQVAASDIVEIATACSGFVARMFQGAPKAKATTPGAES